MSLPFVLTCDVWTDSFGKETRNDIRKHGKICRGLTAGVCVPAMYIYIHLVLASAPEQYYHALDNMDIDAHLPKMKFSEKERDAELFFPVYPCSRESLCFVPGSLIHANHSRWGCAHPATYCYYLGYVIPYDSIVVTLRTRVGRSSVLPLSSQHSCFSHAKKR